MGRELREYREVAAACKTFKKALAGVFKWELTQGARGLMVPLQAFAPSKKELDPYASEDL